MFTSRINKAASVNRLLLQVVFSASALLLTAAVQAAAPGITGPIFNLTAQPAYITQPDGASIYSWGYGCNGAPSGFAGISAASGASSIRTPIVVPVPVVTGRPFLFALALIDFAII